MQNKVLKFRYIQDGIVTIISPELPLFQLYWKEMTVIRIEGRIPKVKMRLNVADDDLVRGTVIRLVVLY